MEDNRNLSASNHLLPQNYKIRTHEEKDCIFYSRFNGVVDEYNDHRVKDNVEFSYKHLFQKVLTPSDIELSRFVIPMRYATEYFPQIQQNEEVSFYDTSSTLWKFKFFYCKSSQKCTFTRGWPKFVKDKGLRAKDIVVFNLYEFKNGTKENCNAFVIDVVKNVEVLPMNYHYQQEEMIYDHEEEIRRFMRAQTINHDHAATAALTPVFLFGKQIGWSKTNKANGS